MGRSCLLLTSSVGCVPLTLRRLQAGKPHPPCVPSWAWGACRRPDRPAPTMAVGGSSSSAWLHLPCQSAFREPPRTGALARSSPHRPSVVLLETGYRYWLDSAPVASTRLPRDLPNGQDPRAPQPVDPNPAVPRSEGRSTST